MKIFAMSNDRRKILDSMYAYSQKVADHIIKCIVYTKSHIDYDHWVGEIATWLSKVNSLASSPKKGFKIKSKDYIDNLFVGIGDELPDAKLELEIFTDLYVDKKEYPKFEITYEMYHNLFDAYWEVANILSDRLGKYDNRTALLDIKHDVKLILDKYC